MAQPHHDAVLHRRSTEDWSEGKSVEVNRIKSRARGRELSELRLDVFSQIFFSVGIEGQV